MFPKKGNLFPEGNDRENDGLDYAPMIATALQLDLGHSHRATKTVMQWTGASERTVKHWLAGHHGPSGGYLIVLMSKSEAVYETVLAAAGRRNTVAARIRAAHEMMVEAMAMVEREGSAPAQPHSTKADQHGARKENRSDDRELDSTNDRTNVPDVVLSGRPPDSFNRRQRWYLQALAEGNRITTADLQQHWSVSEKTARRDLTVLKQRGNIEYVGPAKTGRYRLTN